MVCGFCSTGCGLNVHLSDGQAVDLTPDDRLSGEPRAWPAPRDGKPSTVLQAPTARRLRCFAGPTAGLGRSTGTMAMRPWHRDSESDSGEHGPDSVAFLSTGQIVDRGNGAARRITKFGMGMRARRRQHPPVHGHGRRGVQAGLRVRCAPYTYARISRSPTHRSVGATPASLTRFFGSASSQPAAAGDHRRRPTPHRDGDGRHAHLPARPKSDLALLYGVGPAC